jgi:hypothetical protein
MHTVMALCFHIYELIHDLLHVCVQTLFDAFHILCKGHARKIEDRFPLAILIQQSFLGRSRRFFSLLRLRGF